MRRNVTCTFNRATGSDGCMSQVSSAEPAPMETTRGA
jgi:hypothetical protein